MKDPFPWRTALCSQTLDIPGNLKTEKGVWEHASDNNTTL